MAKAKAKMTEINSLDEIPQDMTDDEAAEFFSTHSFGEGLLEQMAPLEEGILPPPRKGRAGSKSPQTSLGLDHDLMRRLKALAHKKGKAYETLLREFVIERLYEEEKREGIIR
jgi:hypothetical protein